MKIISGLSNSKLTLIVALMFTVLITKAQTAYQFSGPDCDGNMHDLYADLDAGKAVFLHFYMPSCSACPPPAQEIQAMASVINASHPGMVVGYAFPFQNSTNCAYSSSWVSSNGLSALYAPMDSGAYQVAYYGGFGMPTVVLLGGTDHRVMFSTLSYSSSDTTIMRDSILALLNATGVNELPEAVASFTAFPNPASNNISVSVNLKRATHLSLELTDVAGKQVAAVASENSSGHLFTKNIDVAALPDGNYLLRLSADGKNVTRKITVHH